MVAKSTRERTRPDERRPATCRRLVGTGAGVQQGGHRRNQSADRAAGRRKPKGAGHERRAEILSAARELFLKEGYEAVTTRKLAQSVGISQTGLYLYFESKDAIYDELCRETFSRLTEALDEIAQSPPQDQEQLARIIEGFIRFGLAHPDEYQLTFMVTHPNLVASHVKDLSLPAEMQGPGMRSFLRFRDQIAGLAAAGHIPCDDVTLVAQAILAAAHGLVAFLIARPWYPWVERERLLDRLTRMIVAGLRRTDVLEQQTHR